MPGPATQAPLEPPGGLDERFCEVMDAAPVMIWVSGQDKLCNWFNKPWLEFTGRSMAQELGNGWAEGVHPDDFTRCLDIYVGHFDARRPFRMQYRLRRHDGVYRWIDDIGIPRQARDGTFLGYVGSCIDIHEHREVQGVLDSAREMQRVVDQTPFLLIRCTRDLRFRFISNSFATMVGRRPEEILGKRIDEVIGPDVYAIIRPRIDQVLEGQRVEFESRTPAHAGERRALHVVYTPERDERGAVTGWIASIIDIDDRKRAEDALRRQRDRAALLSRTLEELLAAKDPDTIVRDLFSRVAGHVNADAFFNFMVDEPGRAMRLHASAGISDALAHSIRRLEFGQAICGRVALHRHPIHATDIQNSSEEASALVRGWGIQAYFCNPLLVGEDLLGTLSFASRSRPSFDDDEREFLTTVSQYTAIAMHRLRSEAALRESEERLRMLLAEVNHRSKNMLALVQTVARQTAKSGPEDFISRFEQRIRALSASQDLLVSSEWKGVDIEQLVRSQLAHFHDLIGKRISLSGPPIRLTAAAAQALGMALHELATNAGKYGALSNEAGRVEIAWELLEGDGRGLPFAISWVERDGPRVKPPTRRGFGSTVLDRMVRTSLGASVTLDYAPEGVVWRLECQDARLVDGGRDSGRTLGELDFQNGKAGPRVLVVEDEPLIALEVSNVLEQANYVVVGPADSVEVGLKLLAHIECDCAILDINLGATTAEPIARELQSRNIPFLTVSGYSRAQQPPIFHGAPFLAKPVNPHLLLLELRKLCGNQRPGAAAEQSVATPA